MTRRFARRALVGLVYPALLATTIEREASAADSPALHLRAVQGVPALSIGVVDGKLMARACAQSPCVLTGGADLKVPESHAAKLASVELKEVPVGKGRSVAMATVYDPETKQSWVALVGSTPQSMGGVQQPSGASNPNDVKVIFSGVAHPKDEPGATEPNVISASPDPKDPQLLVGTRSDNLSICGRPTMLSPKVLDPADFSLKSVRLQRLDAKERSAATKLDAVGTKREKAPLARLLSSQGASSAIGSPAAVTDGDFESAWSENRGAEGRGEFVMMKAPKEVSLTSFRFTFRPTSKNVDGGVSPEFFWLATDSALFQIHVPEDGWQHAGSSYEVKLPAAVNTTCVSVVLDDAYIGKDSKNTNVSITEIEAFSSFDGTIDLAGLVKILDTNDDRARSAAAVLLRAGDDGRKAIGASFLTLNDGAKALALDAVDQAICSEGATIYSYALASKAPGVLEHAIDRLRACGRAAAPALRAAVDDANHPARAKSARELALIAPDDALKVLVKATSDKPDVQTGLRNSLSMAAQSSRSTAALSTLLLDETLTSSQRVVLLRAAGKRVTEPTLLVPATTALTSIKGQLESFEDRYRSLEPASHLAAAGNELGREILGAAIKDGDKNLRATAVQLAGPITGLHSAVVAAVTDAEPRVKAAALHGLRGNTEGDTRAAAIKVLGDEWTFVRTAAYATLAESGADAAVDKALLKALESERSSGGLMGAIEAVALRKLTSAGSKLKKIAKDTDQPSHIRAAAITAFGTMCDMGSVDFLTDLAKAGANGFVDADLQVLGGAAVAALAKLHPADLEKRLASIQPSGPGASSKAAAIKAAAQEPGLCRLFSQAIY